jgi:DNA-binding transcriptional MerR regulator
MKLFSDKELSELININVETLRTWRRRKIGPQWIKGEGKKGLVRYTEEEVNKWIYDCKARGSN